MKRILGTLTFISSFGWFILLVYLLATERSPTFLPHWLNIVLLIVLLNFSSISYTIVTRFWTDAPSEDEDIEKQNQILKKKIEQRELKGKLLKLESQS